MEMQKDQIEKLKAEHGPLILVEIDDLHQNQTYKAVLKKPTDQVRAMFLRILDKDSPAACKKLINHMYVQGDTEIYKDGQAAEKAVELATEANFLTVASGSVRTL